MKPTRPMTNADVIHAIRWSHLKANTDTLGADEQHADWGHAWVDPGGTIFGPGPYLKVPVIGGEWEGTTQRIYAPAKLRKILSKRWTRPDTET